MSKKNNTKQAEVKAVDAQAVAQGDNAASLPQVVTPKQTLRKAYLSALPFPQTAKLNKRLLAVAAYKLCAENKALAARLLAYTVCNEKIGTSGQALVGECVDNSGMQGYVKPNAAWFAKIAQGSICAVHTAYLRDTAAKFAIELPQA